MQYFKNTAGGNSLKFLVNHPLILGGILLALKYVLYAVFISSSVNLIACFIKVMDFDELITPIDNFLSYGTYSLTPYGEPFTGRLPGFIFPYILFRLFFDSYISVFLLGLFILLLSVYSGVLTLKFVYTKTQSSVLTLISALTLVLFPFYWHWEWTIHPNSLSVSALTFIIISFDKFIETHKLKHILICGFFLGWVFMLRGFTFLFLPVTLMMLLYFMSKNKFAFKKGITTILMLILPFGIMETCWVIRNAISVNKFIPLQTALVPGGDKTISYYNYANPVKSSMLYVRDLISCWGGDNFWYFKNADMYWFVSPNTMNPRDQFPQVTFKAGIEPQQLLELKSNILISFSDSLTPKQHTEVENRIIDLSSELRARFLSNQSLYYYTLAPLNRIRNFLYKNVVQDWPGKGFNENNLLQKTVKLISLLSYVLILIASLIVIVSFFKKPTLLVTFIASLGMSLLLLFSITNTCHFSYFMCGYYCFGLFSMLLINRKFFARS